MNAPAQAPGRRSLVIALTCVGCVVVAAAVVSVLSPKPRHLPPPEAGGAPGPGQPAEPMPPLMAHLAPGARFADAQVVGARLLDEGMFRVELKTDSGQPLSVEICRRDPAAAAPGAQTPSLALYLSTQGDGEALPEPTARVLQAIAASLAEREAKGAVVPALKARAETRAHPPGQAQGQGG